MEIPSNYGFRELGQDEETVVLPETKRIPWQPIKPLEDENRLKNGSLGALDALREEWHRRLSAFSEADRARIRQRSLRRLSVETGIIERLYEVDWGLTLTLVAEGFTKDVVERAGGQVDERTLATLRAQLDSLGMVLDFVHQNRPLSAAFIRELHQAITRTQDTYTATDTLGRIVERPLQKGQWKTQPNHVLRHDNTLLEYAPPEQVGSEIDQLITYWNVLESSEVHAITKAAWLHHRFAQIHPFADGNGRVARALTLLVVEKSHYAPLVIDRWHREKYLHALDAANDGKLTGLVDLFIKLESAALTGELERPTDLDTSGFAVDIAHTLAAQLAAVRRKRETELLQMLKARAIAVGGRLKIWFDHKGGELKAVFREQGLADVQVIAHTEMPPSPKTYWYRHQITESAHTAGYYAEFRNYVGWSDLRIRIDRSQLRYVASLHGVGREPGIMGVTTFGEIEPYLPHDDAEEKSLTREYIRTTTDAFRFVHTETIEQINGRAAELESLLDEGLAVALSELLKRT
jgi:fido (protein-threonine AMPylation protein)